MPFTFTPKLSMLLGDYTNKMSLSHEMLITEGEELLREFELEIPLARMINFILRYAETGEVDHDELQDLAVEIRSQLENSRKAT